MDFLLVGAGGFLGSMARYGVSLLARTYTETGMLIGTLTVNILGCFTIGILNGWIERQPAASPSLQLFVSVGLLGGFTTFSTFGWETVQLLRMQQTGLAVFNVVASLGLGFGAVWLGRWLLS